MMNWLSIILLNLLWFASVLGAANQIIWPSAMGLCFLLILLLSQQAISRLDVKIISISLLCGWVIDGYLSYSGLIIYEAGLQTWQLVPPLWILFLWVGFGATITKGMQWMFNYPLIGSLFMLIGAPLSYYSAEKLGAVMFTNYLVALPMIALSWLVYFFILLQILSYRKVRNDTVVQ